MNYFCRFMVASLMVVFFLQGCQEGEVPRGGTDPGDRELSDEKTGTLSEDERSIRDELGKVDGAFDPEWRIEKYYSMSKLALSEFGAFLEGAKTPSLGGLRMYLAYEVNSPGVAPDKFLSDSAEKNGLRIRHWKSGGVVREFSAKGFLEEFGKFSNLVRSWSGRSVNMKTHKGALDEFGFTSTIFLTVSGKTLGGTPVQLNAECLLSWSNIEEKLILDGWEFLSLELIEADSWNAEHLFKEYTSSVIPRDGELLQQLSRGISQRVLTTQQSLGISNEGHNGVSLADVDGDLVDDLFLCQTGGMPNRLLLRKADGSLIDFSDESGLNFLDNTSAALFVDFDQDGDQDAALAFDERVMFFSNDGGGRFSRRGSFPTEGKPFGLCAADIDGNGFPDLYVSCYNSLYNTDRLEQKGVPIPLHRAENGSRNLFLAQSRAWLFENKTAAVGLEMENQRWSFSACWEDLDQDGDLELYVANDFGPNQIFRNMLKETGKLSFRDLGALPGMQDTGFGMSVSCGDANRDGYSDIYLSNMFSGAGNRISFQEHFLRDAGDETRKAIQQMSQGNSFYLSRGNMAYQESAALAGVNMGRWAWGNKQVDLNNDGWLDMVVANGFITQEDTDDL